MEQRGLSLGQLAIGLAVFSAAMWFVWLSWGGPSYDPAQVVACGACVVAGSLAAFFASRGRFFGDAVVLALSADFGFAVPWAVDASDDPTGLWLFGLISLVLGSGIGLSVLLSATAAIATASRFAQRRNVR